MGLDMYLEADQYIWPEDYSKPRTVELGNTTTTLLPFEPRQVSYNVLTWRKANAIHKWFVDNVQGGVDECDRHEVSAPQIRSLLNICKAILAEKDPEKQEALALDTLPPTEGFFFGSQEIDEWYISDLQMTVKGLEKLLEVNAKKYRPTGADEDSEYFTNDVFYHSSW